MLSLYGYKTINGGVGMFIAFLIIATLLGYMLLTRIDLIKNLINTDEEKGATIGCAILCILMVFAVIGSFIFSIV